MPSLVLIRHGIAFERTDPLAPADEERPLTVKGANRVRRAGRGLRALGLKPSLILTSPHLRSVQTAELILKELRGNGAKIRKTDALSPGGHPVDFWNALKRTPFELALCIGHQSSLERILAELLGLPPATRFDLKRVSAAYLDFDFDPTPSGRLEWLLSPKLLRKFDGQ